MSLGNNPSYRWPYFCVSEMTKVVRFKHWICVFPSMIEILTANNVKCLEEDQAIVALQSLPPTSVRLDYHGVLDTISVTERLPSYHSYCVISYVGFQGEKHHLTKSELLDRIQARQILFAILVFQKGYTRKEKRVYTVPGSKAWVLAHLPESSPHTYFLDDHKEHLTSTHILCPRIHCRLYSTSVGSLSEYLASL
jgi:hypothetical protein